MKMLQSSAQTLPLWVGKPGEKAPSLCGAVPMEASYVAKVLICCSIIMYRRSHHPLVFLKKYYNVFTYFTYSSQGTW